MNPNSPTPQKNPWMLLFSTKTLTVGGEVGCLTLLIVLGAVFGGIWLDRLLGTKPLFTIGLVLLSAPISLVLTYWIATRAVKDIKPSGERQQPPGESDEGEDR